MEIMAVINKNVYFVTYSVSLQKKKALSQHILIIFGVTQEFDNNPGYWSRTKDVTAALNIK